MPDPVKPPETPAPVQTPPQTPAPAPVEKKQSPFEKVISASEKEPVKEVSEAEKKEAEEKARVEAEKLEKERLEAEKNNKKPEDQKPPETPAKTPETPAPEPTAEQKELATLKTRLQEYESDPIGTLKKNHPQAFDNLRAESNPEQFIAQWQQTELLAELKKQFPDKVGDDWVFDPAEAHSAGTPSYKYRVMTEEKESAIAASIKSRKDQEEAILTAYSKQRDEDLQFLATTYGLTQDQLKAKLQEFDALHEQVSTGKASKEKHPFALRNVYRGAFFDELVKIHEQRAAEKAVSDLKDLYKSKGIVLPEVTMTDPTKNKPDSQPPAPPTKKKKGFAGIMESAANSQ